MGEVDETHYVHLVATPLSMRVYLEWYCEQLTSIWRWVIFIFRGNHMLKNRIAEDLHKVLEDHLSMEEVIKILEIPSNEEYGDLSFPTFTLAPLFRKSPKLIAEDISMKFQSELVSSVEVINGYINFYIDKNMVSTFIMDTVLGEKFGDTSYLEGQSYAMDFSSPNIAKPFSMGHLRATILGDSLSRLLKKNGAAVIGINHLGDWGTQFGKLIVAYSKWGDAQKVEANPIQELFALYTRFHKEADKNPSLNQEARDAFSKLERGDRQYLDLWEWFRTVSLEAFQKLYDQLDISFDYIQGESFYNDKLEATSILLEKQNLLEYDDEAYIVQLEDVPPALIKKKDGASLYITRDIAAMLYRTDVFYPDKILYVVGQEQSVHFEQLSQLGELLDLKPEIRHIPFGLILKDGKKMSTRKGEVILLEDIIEDVKKEAMFVIDEKNPELQDKEAVAEKIAVSAIKFHDLKNDRMNSYDFIIEDMLKFDGETAIYVMYTNSRIHSILRKSELDSDDAMTFDDAMWPLLKHMARYEDVLVEAADRYAPSVICRYTLQLCRLFNAYYGKERIIGSGNEQSKLILLKQISKIIKDAMSVLGMEVVDEM